MGPAAPVLVAVAAILFFIDAVRSGSLVSAGLTCFSLSFLPGLL